MGANALNIDFIGGTIGDGSFGDVFRGTLRGAPIAFKRFKMFRQRDYLEDMTTETCDYLAAAAPPPETEDVMPLECATLLRPRQR